MSVVAEQLNMPAPDVEALLQATGDIVERELKPLTVKIDLEGLYPEQVMRNLGEAGAFRPHLPALSADGSHDLGATIQAMARVSHECMSTGFAMWCQDTAAWYLQNLSLIHI